MMLVSLLNAVLGFVFSAVYAPTKWLGPLVSLMIISALAGLLLVWVFGKVSNQSAIQRTRNRLSAELIALRLFKDDLRVFFGIQASVLGWTMRYLRYSLVPMLILMVPTILILVQLNLHFGARPLHVGEQALVKVKLRGTEVPDIKLTAPGNIAIETAGVHIPNLHEITWRIRGAAPGRFELTASDGQNAVTKTGAVGGRLEGVSTLRSGEGWLTALLNPGEAPLPGNSPIQSFEVTYPELELSLLGFHLNWLVLFLALSLVVGYGCKGLLGVQI